MQYRVLQPVQLPPGVVLGLDEAQLQPRRPWLRAVGDGLVETTGPVWFKAGELVQIIGDAARAYPQALQAVQAEPQRDELPAEQPAEQSSESPEPRARRRRRAE